MPKAAELRRMNRAEQRMRLFSVDDAGEQLLGEYEFHRARHPDMK